MSTIKHEQINEKDCNAYDEYLYEMQKKYDCERERIFKQIEFKKGERR